MEVTGQITSDVMMHDVSMVARANASNRDLIRRCKSMAVGSEGATREA